MRRVALVAAAVVAVALAAALLVRGAASSGDYRVGAVFDTARGIAKGSVVKIAGATVGEVDDVRLTAGQKALVVMSVDGRFEPFHSDASCAVRPEGLIGVRSIDCDPGTTHGAALSAAGLPVVPLRRTQVPVDITDFFSIWAAPTRDRLRLLLDELGMGLAARGRDLNSVLLRLSPALRQTRRALAILDAQRHGIRRLIVASDRVTADLAAHAGGLRATLREAAATFGQTADERVALRAGIHGLPTALSATRAGLRRLTSFSTAAVPVLSELRTAAPQLDGALAAAPAFARDAAPALRSLGPALETTGRTLVDATPMAAQLERFTRDAGPSGRNIARLLVDARDAGAVENLLYLSYIGAAIGSRFDRISHLFPTSPLTPGCNYTDAPDKACDARYDKTYASATRAHRRHQRRRRARPRPAVAAPRPAAPEPQPEHKPLLTLPRLPSVSDAQQTVDDLLQILIKP
jgi:phospholipid/cholesterol/gamma-HCH transport system substrate-binding protein